MTLSLLQHLILTNWILIATILPLNKSHTVQFGWHVMYGDLQLVILTMWLLETWQVM
jgi:hypothetical protein